MNHSENIDLGLNVNMSVKEVNKDGENFIDLTLSIPKKDLVDAFKSQLSKLSNDLSIGETYEALMKGNWQNSQVMYDVTLEVAVAVASVICSAYTVLRGGDLDNIQEQTKKLLRDLSDE